MDDLAAFIEARLADDEAAAMALGPVEGRWIIVTPEHGDEALLASETRGHAYLSLPLPMLDFLRHIIRHDPARVLREVAAKRAIVADHATVVPPNIGPRKGEPCCRTCGAVDDDPYLAEPWPCDTIKAIAAVWSDHPDYSAEWAPAL